MLVLGCVRRGKSHCASYAGRAACVAFTPMAEPLDHEMCVNIRSRCEHLPIGLSRLVTNAHWRNPRTSFLGKTKSIVFNHHLLDVGKRGANPPLPLNCKR